MRKMWVAAWLVLAACGEKASPTKPVEAPPIAEVKLSEARAHEMYGRFAEALAALEGVDDPRVAPVRERLKKKLETARDETARREAFAKFSGDAPRLEVEASANDGVKRWQAVVDAFAGMEANAPSDIERAKARAGATRAESRRDWAAAREAQASGDLEGAYALAQKAAAVKDAPTALVAFAESMRAAREPALRQQAFAEHAAKARAEKGPAKALPGWRRIIYHYI